MPPIKKPTPKKPSPKAPASTAAVAPAVAPAPPKLEVELLKSDYAILCTSVAKVPGGYAMTGVARPTTYRSIGSIRAEGASGSHVLFFSKDEERSTPSLTVFRILAPNAVLNTDLQFAAIDKNDGSRTALTAGRKAKLPAKWSFGPYHLALQFKPKDLQQDMLEERCYVRSLDLLGDIFKVDLSIFLQSPLDQGAGAAELQLISPDQDEPIFSTPLSIAEAKKVFRVPASMHQYFSDLRIVHAEAAIPALTVFDESAVYDLTVNWGGKRLPIYPYNRYYFEKQTSLILNAGDHLHVIRHFAGTDNQAIRIAYQ